MDFISFSGRWRESSRKYWQRTITTMIWFEWKCGKLANKIQYCQKRRHQYEYDKKGSREKKRNKRKEKKKLHQPNQTKATKRTVCECVWVCVCACLRQFKSLTVPWYYMKPKNESTLAAAFHFTIHHLKHIYIYILVII